MAEHTTSPHSHDGSPAPEPPYAERARTLVHVARAGTLASVSRKHPGHPFASLMPYALDAAGRPLFLISSMAMHTHNVATDPRASLFVTEPDATGDPLAHARVTVMGEVRPVAEPHRADARAVYLARHPHATYWVDFKDFHFWQLDVTDVYYVGGFGAMDWITPADYLAAAPDPLADVAPSIIEHMNRDHADALVTYARVLAGEPAAEAAMVAIDRLGFKLVVRSGERRHSVRIAFPGEVTTAASARAALIAMLRDARARV